MEFLFKPRDSGKRQVKPSQDIDLLEAQIIGEESSDDSGEEEEMKEENTLLVLPCRFQLG